MLCSECNKNPAILFYKKIFILWGLMYNIQFEVMFCIIH